MNLVMCCTDINHEHDFESQLRFPLLATLFFKRTYPEGKVYVGTTLKAKIPDYYKQFFNVARFDFRANPFAISRQMFYGNFCAGDHFTDDTIFTGSDVLMGNRRIPDMNCKMMMSYRYHPSQPYCADLVLVKKDHGKFAAELFSVMVKMISFMPRKVRFFWADQIALAIEVGKLMPDEFDGNTHRSPRYQDILLVPGDDYLYTPNDIFSSVRRFDTTFTRTMKDVKDTNELVRLIFTKYAIHFKGTRKPWMIALSYLAWKNKWIDPYQFGNGPDPEQLFNGAFKQERAAA